MKTNIKVLIGVLALVVIGASVYFSKNELQKGATRRPVGPQPDYEIESITVDPANPVEGENFEISVVVKNRSSATAATVPSKTLLHLSGRPLPIATTQPLGPLATEEEVWQTTSAQRRLLIRSCADVERNIAESNERNNCREITLDLLPPPIQEQPPLPPCTEGQYACDSWTACSAEGSQTGTSCTVNSDSRDTCVIPLGPLTRACTYVPPPPPSCTEDQYTCDSWTACSAEGSQTGSSCTANSGVTCAPPVTATRACTYVPPPMPDLVIETVTLTQDPSSGVILATIRISNIGTAAVNFTTNYPLRISSNFFNTYISETLLGSNGAGGATAFTLHAGSILGNIYLYSHPDNWANATDVRFTIDSRNVAAESNETNNTYDITIPAEFLAWIPTPDLYITPINIIPDTATARIAGSPVYFNAQVLNSNPTTAPASTTTLTINGTSTSASLGEVYRQDVATPSGPGSTTVNFEWPSAIEGTFIANVCADSGLVVPENRRWNNCTPRYFTVAPAPSE